MPAMAVPARAGPAKAGPARGGPAPVGPAKAGPARAPATCRSLRLAVHRADLDLSVTGPGPGCGELQRDVQIGRLDDPEAGQVLLGFQEGPVSHQPVARPVVD